MLLLSVNCMNQPPISNPPNPNHIEVDSCADAFFLLILEVERWECHTESESHGGWVVCRWPKQIERQHELFGQMFYS